MDDMERLLPASLEGTDPELCIKLFKSTKKKNFNGLKRRIECSDKKWNELFVEQNGLETVLDALSEQKEASMLDGNEKLESISCINAILNNKIGMKHCVMKGDEFVRRYIEGQCFYSSYLYIVL